MWNDGQIVGSGHGSDLDELGHPSQPHHVRLQDVDVPALDQFAESVSVRAGGRESVSEVEVGRERDQTRALTSCTRVLRLSIGRVAVADMFRL